MAQTILYYPHINIQDGVWLRNAVLYWDEVSSIVPYESYEGLSPELEYLAQSGVYSPVNPRSVFYSEYADDFCKAIKRRASCCYSFAGKQDDRHISCRNQQEICDPALFEAIHYNKIPAHLWRQLFEKGLIADGCDDGWFLMDAQFANVYMRTLAEFAIKCSRKDTVLGTGNAKNLREVYPSARRRDENSQCCRINIADCLPMPSLDVGFEEILDFKAKRKDELLAFRGKIRELEMNLYHAQNPEEVQYYEAKFKERWEIYSGDFRKAAKSSGIKFFLGSLSTIVAAPLLRNVMTQRFGESVADTIQTCGPFISIGISYFDYRNKLNPHNVDSGFSYIIKASKAGLIQL